MRVIFFIRALLLGQSFSHVMEAKLSSIFNLLVFFSVFLCCNVYSKELNTGDYESAYSKGPYRNGYVTSREQAIFLNSIISVIKKGNLKSVKILDFGCGDGRHFSIIQKMHKLFFRRKKE